MTNLARRLGALSLLLSLLGCDDAPKKPALDSQAQKPIEPPPVKPVPPEGPPDLVIDSIGPKVGFERENFQFPDGRQKLAAALARNRHFFEGKQATLVVDRKAKQEWVSAYLSELARIGVPNAVVKTETRAEFPHEVAFTPESKLGNGPGCSTVAMVLADRGTAVWKLSGGVAGKRGKGMAGPDLSMTGDTIERVAKGCKEAGAALFVAGAPEIEWGLVYDLAASTKKLNVRYEAVSLLSVTPVPGRKVEVSR